MSTGKKMQILMITSSFPRFKGDYVGDFVYRLAKSLVKKGINVSVLCPAYPRGVRKETISGISVYRFPYFFDKWQLLSYGSGILPNIRDNPFLIFLVPFFLLSATFHLILLSYQLNVDVINPHWAFPQGFISVLTKGITRKKILLYTHGAEVFGLRNQFFRKIHNFTFKRVDKSIANSNYTASVCKKIYNHEIDIVPMGYDSEIFYKIDVPKKEKQVFYLGTLIERKGLEYLIKAMAMVAKKDPRVKLFIAGDGIEKDKLQSLASSLNLLDKQIFFIGRIEEREKVRFFQESGLFVLPSIIDKDGNTEGQGVVLLEALASSCAVIASDVGGIPDIIKDGETGLLVPQKNPQAIAETINRLIENPEMRRRLAENGRRYVAENFSWEVVGERYRQILNCLRPLGAEQ